MNKKVLVIGSGHNGLVASIILARNGFQVEVLEKLAFPGGMAGTTYLGGVEVPIGAYVVGLIPDVIYRETGINVDKYYPDPIAVYQIDRNNYIKWWRSPSKRVREFKKLGLDRKVKTFMDDMARYYNIMLSRYLLTTSPPSIDDLYNDPEAKDLVEMTIKEYLEELFPDYLWPMFIFPIYYSEPLFTLVYYNPPMAWYYPVWGRYFGVSALIRALYSRAIDHGVRFRFSAKVEKILVDRNNLEVKGVKLESGKVIEGDIILSTASPVNTLLDLIEYDAIDNKYVERLNSVSRYRLDVAKITIVFNVKPKLIDPLESYRESIFQLSIGEMIVRDNLVVSVGTPNIEGLAEYITNMGSENIKAIDILTSRDLESIFSVKGGYLNHLPMTKEYMFSCRPICGWGYRTPIKGLYIGGAGAWPGGQITGIPGRNSAYTIISDYIK